MSENVNDTVRAIAAAKAIIDCRDPVAKQAEILLTAEHAIAAVLVAVMGDARLAAGMLNNGLVPGIEERLAYYSSKGGAA
ncbi:conserved hypothetical protein [Agrobacterium deltaense Zutra 3/1]|uniref:Uncharacterized protein n=1 Tax=Agrobacterium deltaense Zutra 3/1 TaxID=1183427 RepID=A0A1S7QSF0_9HYPH|nr:hypothetical protein [Agrobacterium deltaense]CUX41456.1 conserved hypothetical protein [Agrobacterium deltaense Zutra 3/1]